MLIFNGLKRYDMEVNMKSRISAIAQTFTKDVNWKRVKILSSILVVLIAMWACMEIYFRIMY